MSMAKYSKVGEPGVQRAAGMDNLSKILIGVAVVVGAFLAIELLYWSGSQDITDNAEYDDVEEGPFKFDGKLQQHEYDSRFSHINYYSHGSPDSEVQIFALHGGEKDENALSWTPLMDFFRELGTFYLLDIPGWGKSEIFKWQKSVPAALGAYILSDIMEEVGARNKNKKILIVTKGFGTETLFQLYRKNGMSLLKENVFAVMISPTPTLDNASDEQSRKMANIEGLAIISEKDAICPQSYIDLVKNFFSKDKISQEVIPEVSTHSPEKTMPYSLAKIISKWWDEKKDIAGPANTES